MGWTVKVEGAVEAMEKREEIRHESGYLRASDGTRLFWQGVSPAGEHRTVVGMLHGYNSCSDYLLPMMWSLAEAGTASFAIDYRGHGKSEGTPRHVSRFTDYLSDVSALCGHVSARAGEREIFLFGNSLGGLIASHYGLVHPDQLRGVVLTAPFFGPAFRVPCLVDFCARAAGVVFPNCRVAVPQRFPDQPRQISLRWWVETLRAQRLFWKDAERFRLPVLVLHGQEDAVACPSVARELFERLGSRDKTFRILPGARHGDLDPIWGPDWWSEVREWLTHRVDQRHYHPVR